MHLLQHLFGVIGLKFKLHGFDPERIFVQFSFHVEGYLHIVQADVLDCEILILIIAYTNSLEIEKVFSFFVGEFKLHANIESLSLDWNFLCLANNPKIFNILCNKAERFSKLLLLESLKENINRNLLIGFKFSFLYCYIELLG